MKRVRDKRGLQIEAGDTLVGGRGNEVVFIEVDGVDEVNGVCYGHDLDDVTYIIGKPYQYVSVCACYRDARAQVARETANAG